MKVSCQSNYHSNRFFFFFVFFFFFFLLFFSAAVSSVDVKRVDCIILYEISNWAQLFKASLA